MTSGKGKGEKDERCPRSVTAFSKAESQRILVFLKERNKRGDEPHIQLSENQGGKGRISRLARTLFHAAYKGGKGKGDIL